MSVSCSLPPQVDGQLRCFLSVLVGELHWTIPSGPNDVLTSVLFWGQKEKPTFLRPVVRTDPTFKASERNIEAYFPIRCGPKQFAAYLEDMDSLHLDILYGPTRTLFGKVKIPNLKTLTASNPLIGVYPILCITSNYRNKHVGNLEVSLVLKTTADVFNIKSTSPNGIRKDKTVLDKKKIKGGSKSKEEVNSHKKKHVQISKDLPDRITYNTTNPVLQTNDNVSFVVGPGSDRQKKQNSLIDISTDVSNNENSKKDVVADVKRKQFENIHTKIGNSSVYDNNSSSSDDGDNDTLLLDPFVVRNEPFSTKTTNETKKSCIEDFLHSASHSGTPVYRRIETMKKQLPIDLDKHHQQGVLASLLTKGQFLRNKMIKSSLESQHERLQAVQRESFNTGSLIRELLDDKNVSEDAEHFGELGINSQYFRGGVNKHIELKAVDLVLGEDDKIDGLLKKLDTSQYSVYSSVFSEDQDPLHDSSLLSDLFYNHKTHQVIDESSILFSDDENQVSDIQKQLDHEKQKEMSNMENENGKSFDSVNPIQLHDGSTETAESDDEPSIDTKFSNILPEQVSVQQLTELGRVKSVRVYFKDMILRELKGIVYFIETTFPMSIEDFDDTHAQETLRLVSRKVNKENVEFHRVSVFPVFFNETMINYWWNNNIYVTILGKLTKDKKAEEVGKGVIKLRKVLTDQEFTHEFQMDIVCPSSKKEDLIVGKLAVRIELIRDHQGGGRLRNKQKTITLKHQPTIKIKELSKNASESESDKKTLTPIKINRKARTLLKKSQKDSTDEIPSCGMQDQCFGKKINDLFPTGSLNKCSVLENTLLQSVILIEEGKDIFIDDSSKAGCNLYFVCRVFWSKEEIKSKICWNTNNPVFQYQQVIAVPMVVDNVNKMKHNYMIVEVWHKYTTTQTDKLIGMSKVPLHQFYLSYRDAQIAEAIMKSKYPVISQDGWVHVRNLITGKEQGCLKILVALGMHDQVMELLLIHGSRQTGKRQNALKTVESVDKPSPGVSANSEVTHQIDITIESFKGILQNDSEVWGETDCFMQYNFPVSKEDAISLTTFQTKMALCVPSPVFNHNILHKIFLAHNVPLQQLLLNSYKSTSTPAEIVFELWKRYYYPNIRDQLIAMAKLPIAKLCAMITMHGRNEVSSQSFQLPFSLVNKKTEQRCISDHCGMLDIFIKYQNNYFERRNLKPINDAKVVCLSVSILKLCGLKASLNYNSDKTLHCGVQSYVKTFFSFSKQSYNRTTQIAVRSFSPTFNYHVEFPLNFISEDDRGKETCLAKLLEDSDLNCQVFCVRKDVEDLFLGQASIPLLNVLYRSTGIKGWWPLYYDDQSKLDATQCLSGGIEVESKFRNPDERDAIINHGLSCGWTPYSSIQLNHENWFSAVTVEQKPCLIHIFIDQLWLPDSIMKLIVPLVPSLKKTHTKVYARYKFYDKAPVCSHCENLNKYEKRCYSSKLLHLQSFKISPTTSFAWYLREEKLEIQFWLTSQQENNEQTSPKSTDSLIGSCYIDMMSCSKSPYQKLTLSEQYSLFKPSSDDICDACVRVIISMNEPIKEDITNSVRCHDTVDCLSDGYSETEVNDKSASNEVCIKSNDDNIETKVNVIAASAAVEKDKVPIRFQIDEALHLPKHLQGSSYVEPNVYVTYQLPNCEIVYTHVCHQTTKPQFNFQRMETFDPLALKDIRLVYNIWRSVGKEPQVERDVLLGFSEVNTDTLYVGMKQIIGWYNVLNLNRQIVGQLKVGIIPAVTLSPSRSSKFFKHFDDTPPLNLDMAFFSKKRNTELDVGENASSSSMLFLQLKENLNDLSNMTSKLKERLEMPRQVPENSIKSDILEDNSSGISVIQLPKTEEGKVKQPMVYSTSCSRLDTNPAEFNSMILPDKRVTVLISPNQDSRHLRQDKCSKEKASCMNGRGISLSDDDETANGGYAGDNDEDQSSGQSEVEKVESQSECDSTDELMEHLKLFEKKYKHLKDIAQNDDFDAYSGIIKPLESDNEGDPDHDVVNVSSSDPSRDNINTDYLGESSATKSQHRSNCNFKSPTRSKDNGTDFSTFFDEVEVYREVTEEENLKERKVTDKNQEVESSTLDNPRSESLASKATNQPTTLPNFFMRPQEMAESMRALRIAATFRKPPRKLKQYEEPCTDNKFESTIRGVAIGPSSSGVMKDMIKAELPVEASEMARIASIFSSKP